MPVSISPALPPPTFHFHPSVISGNVGHFHPLCPLCKEEKHDCIYYVNVVLQLNARRLVRALGPNGDLSGRQLCCLAHMEEKEIEEIA